MNLVESKIRADYIRGLLANRDRNKAREEILDLYYDIKITTNPDAIEKAEKLYEIETDGSLKEVKTPLRRSGQLGTTTEDKIQRTEKLLTRTKTVTNKLIKDLRAIK